MIRRGTYMLAETELKTLYHDREAAMIEDWFALLRIPSVSADPTHAEDCRRCAQHLTELLNAAGFQAECLATGHKPLVFAERPGDRPGPMTLIYGHYDVQPADPLEDWDTPPFEPVIRDGRCYARGAQDNKGQLMVVIGALRALIATGVPLPPLKFCIEGEEENCSAGIAAVMAREPERFAADTLLVHDTNMAPSGAAAITMGLRGIVQLTATLHGPDHDLHSGMHGGLAPNPVQGLAQLLTTLHATDGSIAVDGYYDAVRPASASEQRLAEATPFDTAAYRAATGCLPLGGRANTSAAMRLGFLPSLDMNGITGGYRGPGVKTIVPARATVKLSSRLVPDQDPETCLSMIERHLQRHVPPGFRLTIDERGAIGPGFRLDPESPLVAAARRALAPDGDPVELRWEGASIPIVTSLSQTAGAAPLLVGFGLETDRIHAPNESFALDRFRQGFLYICRLMQALGMDDG